MQVDDGGDKAEPQAIARGGSAAIQPVEAAQDLVSLARRDAGAGVGDDQARTGLSARCQQADLDDRAARGMAQSVLDQIVARQVTGATRSGPPALAGTEMVKARSEKISLERIANLIGW